LWRDPPRPVSAAALSKGDAMAGVDDRIEESKNWLERFLEKVPGYRGYKQKELRREADKVERVFTAGRLDGCLAGLDQLKLDLVKAQKLDLVGEVDVVMRKLRRVRDRLQFADYGYAGLFDPTKVDQAVLDQLRAFDQALETEATGVCDLAESLAADSPSLAADLRLLGERLETFDARLSDRETIVTGAGR